MNKPSKLILLAACFLLNSCWPYSSTLKIEAVRFSETEVKFYRTTWCHNPEHSTDVRTSNPTWDEFEKMAIDGFSVAKNFTGTDSSLSVNI
jgi:hypothetical protein